MLSHDEDRHLREIERWFEESDPAFTKMLRAHAAPERSRWQAVGRIAIDVTGALLFVGGAAAASAMLMVFGVLLLGIGACLHLTAHP